MTLRAVLTVLLVPPANLAILAAIGLLAWRAGVARRAARWLAGISLACLLLLSLPVLADRLLVSLERGLHGPLSQPPPAAIVVLGGDLERDAASPLGADPGPLTLDRLREAALLARRTGLPLLVSGGIVLRGAAPVAAVMARSLRDDFGVPVRWVEPVSATTWDNAQDSAPILAAAGIGSAFVVTQAWHMRRALIAFARTGLAVTPAPVRRDVPAEWSLDTLLPHATAWTVSYYALHEWIGCGWYWLRARWSHG